MYEVVQLRAQANGYALVQTDYPLMVLEDALAIANELTRDAIDHKWFDRWTVIPAEHNGRPWK